MEHSEPRINDSKRKADVVQSFVILSGKPHSWIPNKKRFASDRKSP